MGKGILYFIYEVGGHFYDLEFFVVELFVGSFHEFGADFILYVESEGVIGTGVEGRFFI